MKVPPPRPASGTADFSRELALRPAKLWPVAGIDEVGRGPLAGPVAAAAVILDPDNLPAGLADSKALNAKVREELFEAIMDRALAVGIGLATAREIESINIRQATFLAMRRACRALPLAPGFALIDGRDVPSGLPCRAEAIIKGDALSLSIAAASIVAKVTRDRLMVRLSQRHPHYGFATHMGYATAAHREALAKHGPCEFHRMTFGALKKIS